MRDSKYQRRADSCLLSVASLWPNGMPCVVRRVNTVQTE